MFILLSDIANDIDLTKFLLTKLIDYGLFAVAVGYFFWKLLPKWLGSYESINANQIKSNEEINDRNIEAFKQQVEKERETYKLLMKAQQDYHSLQFDKILEATQINTEKMASELHHLGQIIQSQTETLNQLRDSLS